VLTSISALLAASCGGSTVSPAPQSAGSPPSTPATRSAEPSVSPAIRTGPIVVIFFENHSYGQIIGNSCCPYLNAQASQGRTYANYRAITHPSLPNYLAVSGGSTCSKQGTDSVAPYCTGRNLWDQLLRAGDSWRVYEESMPSHCSLSDTSTYAVRHNPEAIYADQEGTQTCANHDVALAGSFTSLPAFTFVTPNICHDMHSCTAATGDAWLRAWLPKFLAVPGTRVVVTFDEGSIDNHVAAFEVGFGVPETTVHASYDHYSLLAGIEDALGLPRLGNAVGARPLPI
jgi:hypothetical protein